MDYPAWVGIGGVKDTRGMSPSREGEEERKGEATSRTLVDENRSKKGTMQPDWVLGVLPSSPTMPSSGGDW